MYTPQEINNSKKLAQYLRCEESLLPSLEDKQSIQEVKILKRNVWLGYRTVYFPKDITTSNVLKQIKFILNQIYIPASCVYGFVKGRGIADNAKVHLNKAVVLNIDIKDFFETISFEAILKMFERQGYNPDISQTLTRIVTYNNTLVAGFNTSPIIANMICVDMDNEILKLCSDHNIAYSRYADDLSFSGDNVDIKDEIITILNRYGFEPNPNKIKLFKKGRSQYVTGLTVSDNIRPRIPRKIKKELRANLYYIGKFGFESYMEYIGGFPRKEAARIMGWLHYINGIEPEFANKYLKYIDGFDEESKDCLLSASQYISDKKSYYQPDYLDTKYYQ